MDSSLEDQLASERSKVLALAAKLEQLQESNRRVPDSFYWAVPPHSWSGNDIFGLQRYLSGCEMYFAGFPQEIPDNAKISYAVKGLAQPMSSRWYAHCASQDGGAEAVIRSMTWEDYVQWCRVFDGNGGSLMVRNKMLPVKQKEGQSMVSYLGEWQELYLDQPDPAPISDQINHILDSLLPVYKDGVTRKGWPESIDDLWQRAAWLDAYLKTSGKTKEKSKEVVLVDDGNEEQARLERDFGTSVANAVAGWTPKCWRCCKDGHIGIDCPNPVRDRY